MPEGDTVFLAARRLDAALGGETIESSDFHVPQHATQDLRGRIVGSVRSRGKHLLFDLGDLVLHTHFEMDGAWHLYRAGERWRGPHLHVRVILRTTSWIAVGFRLPVVELLEPARAVDRLAHLGPDLLGPDWDPDEAIRRLRRDPSRPIGEALLDQRNLAGLGNVYRSEICFLRGIEPSTPVGTVKELGSMVDLAQRLLDANRGTGRQITTGIDRHGRRHWVYGRGYEACRRCGTTIQSYDDANGRVVYLCPICQPRGDA